MVAALLHDVGKTRYPLRLWERVLIVLGRRMFPEKVKEWGSGDPEGWKRAFVIAQQHPDWGADLVEEAGGSPLTVAIIRRHQQELVGKNLSVEKTGDLEEQLISKLQRIDDES